MIPCDEAWENISARFDGEAVPVSTRTLDEHLANCETCATRLAALPALERAVRAAHPFATAELPLATAARVEALFRARVSRPSRRRVLAALAAGLVLAAGAAAAIHLSGHSPGWVPPAEAEAPAHPAIRPPSDIHQAQPGRISP